MRVALLTSGGIAPCLASAVAALVERWTEVAPEVRIIGYRHGYAGLLAGDVVEVGPEMRERIGVLRSRGGSPLGNSRVKLANTDDLVARGLIQAGEGGLEVAARQLAADGVDVLHTIGGDDTSTTAADLAEHLSRVGHDLAVVGLPKTIDNDIVPVRQSLGAWTAAEQGALFARNIVAEHTASPRTLIVHEVMGRHCGWLAAATARRHHDWLATQEFLPGMDGGRRSWDVHAVHVPELPLDVAGESDRLRQVMDEVGNVTVFLSEGAGAEDVVQEMEAAGEDVPRDAFGHVALDEVNPGQWFGKQFAERICAEKVLVQKSGYFSRSAPAGPEDEKLIRRCAEAAVSAARRGESGLVGEDEERGGELRAIELSRVQGGKALDTSAEWFQELLHDIGQI